MVRKAVAEDLPALQVLLASYFDEEGIWERDSPETILGYLRQDELGFYVAQTGETLAGCVLIRHLPTIPGAAECKRLYVLPRFRGRGLAARMMAAGEDAAAEASLYAMYLDSKDEFKTALALYLRLGYEVCERFNNNAQATVFLRKQLG